MSTSREPSFQPLNLRKPCGDVFGPTLDHNERIVVGLEAWAGKVPLAHPGGRGVLAKNTRPSKCIGADGKRFGSDGKHLAAKGGFPAAEGGSYGIRGLFVRNAHCEQICSARQVSLRWARSEELLCSRTELHRAVYCADPPGVRKIDARTCGKRDAVSVRPAFACSSGPFAIDSSRQLIV
jgi:hypothetical protein